MGDKAIAYTLLFSNAIPLLVVVNRLNPTALG